MNGKSLRIVLIAVSAALLILMMIAPFLVPYGSFTHLDGTAGIMDHWNLWTSTNPLSGAVYAIGDILCHQEMSRSFMLNGSQMAVCARDLSVLIGVFTGLCVAAASERTAGGRRVLSVSVFLIMTMVIEWIAEHLTGVDILVLRVTTGILAGIGIALLLDLLLIRHPEYLFDNDQESY